MNESTEVQNPVFKTKLQLRPTFFVTSTIFSDTVTLSEVLNYRIPANPNKDEILRARVIRINDENKYGEQKLLNPGIHFNASFNTVFEKHDVKEYTNLLYIDFDKKDNPSINITDLQKCIQSLPYIVSVWRSFGGTGLGILALAKDITSEATFKQFHIQIRKNIDSKFGSPLIWDKTVCSVSRGCALSYDPDIMTNDNPEPFELVPDNEFETQNKGGDTKCIYKNKNKYALNVTPLNKYYLQEVIDVHQPELVQLADKVYEDGSMLFVEGWNQAKISPQFKKVTVGNRRKKLTGVYITFLKLNFHLSPDRTFQWLTTYNEHICEPPLPAEQLHGIHEYVSELVESGAATTKISKRMSAFPSTSKLSGKEKNAKIRTMVKDRNCIRVQNAINSLISQNKAITRKEIVESTQLNERTVIRHWKPFKEEIENHNQMLKNKAKKREPIPLMEVTPEKYKLVLIWTNPEIKLPTKIKMILDENEIKKLGT